MLSTIFQEGVFQRFFKNRFQVQVYSDVSLRQEKVESPFEVDERAGIKCQDPLIRLLQLDFPETISRFLED